MQCQEVIFTLAETGLCLLLFSLLEVLFSFPFFPFKEKEELS